MTAWQQSWVKREPENEFSRSIVAALLKHKARVTGSWARAELTEDSDFDFYVPEAYWRDFVKDAPGGWESCIVGHMAWHQPDLGLIEASSIFKKQGRGKVLTSVELFNQVWRTW